MSVSNLADLIVDERLVVGSCGILLLLRECLFVECNNASVGIRRNDIVHALQHFVFC